MLSLLLCLLVGVLLSFTEGCKALLADPLFFTELQGENTEKIITSQYDPTEYKNLPDKVELRQNNSCNWATLATIKKMCEFLYTDIVPPTTIADVYKALVGKSFIDVRGYKYEFRSDRMAFVGLADALRLLIPKYILGTYFLTPNYGTRYAEPVPPQLWIDALKNGQEICENGGFTIVHCIKHRESHTVLATDIKDGMAIIVDSNSNTAQRVYFKDFLEPPGAINMIGVTLKPKNINVKSPF